MSGPTSDVPRSRAATVERILGAVDHQECVLILGPRYGGKSTIIQAALDRLPTTYFHTFHFKLTDTIQTPDGERQLASLGEIGLFNWLLQEMVPLLSLPAEHIDGLPKKPKLRFQEAVLRALESYPYSLIIAVDNIEVAAPNLVIALLNVLRSLYTTSVNRSGGTLLAIVCGTLTLGQLAPVDASGFAGIARFIPPGDMDDEEQDAFIERFASDHSVFIAAKAKTCLKDQAARDYLLLYKLCNLCLEIITPEAGEEITSEIAELAGDALVKSPIVHLPHIIEYLRSSPTLIRATLALLRGNTEKPISSYVTSAESPNELDISGYLVEREEEYAFKPGLWQTILQKYLTITCAIDLYQTIGEWTLAFEELKLLYRLRASDDDINKWDVFHYLENAIRQTRSVEEAFSVLYDGLVMLTPAVASRTEPAVWVLEYVPESGIVKQSAFSRWILREPAHTPPTQKKRIIQRAQATFGGLRYHNIEGDLYLPLQTRITAKPNLVGLVIFDGILHKDQLTRIIQLNEHAADHIFSLHFQLKLANQIAWEEKLAAKLAQDNTDQEKRLKQFQEQLQQADKQQQRLENLNKFVDETMAIGSLIPDLVYQLMLAGVTHNVGLQFNRAILFRPDEERRNLMLFKAIGQLKQREARQIWKTTANQALTPEQVIAAIKDEGIDQTGSLHRALQEVGFCVSTTDRNALNEVFHAGAARRFAEDGHGNQMDTEDWLWPPTFNQIVEPPEEWAIIPIRNPRAHSSDQPNVMAILYVDNKFNRTPLTSDRWFELINFVRHFELLVDLSERMQTERQFTELLGSLALNEDRLTGAAVSLPDFLRETCQAACELFDGDCAVLFPFRQDSQLESSKPLDLIYERDNICAYKVVGRVRPTETKRPPEGMTATVVREELVYVPDVSLWHLQRPGSRPLTDNKFFGNEQIKSFIGLRVGLPERPLAVLYVYWKVKQRARLDRSREVIMRIFAQLAATNFKVARRYNVQRMNRDIVERFAPWMTANVDINEIYDQFLQQVQHEFRNKVNNLCIVYMDRDQNHLVIPYFCLKYYAAQRTDKLSDGEDYRHGYTDDRPGIAGRIVLQAEEGFRRHKTKDKGLIINDVAATPDYLPAIETTQSELCVPVWFGDKVIGAFLLESDIINAFSGEDQELMNLLAAQIAIIIQYARAVQKRLENTERMERHELDNSLRTIRQHVRDLRSGETPPDKREEVFRLAERMLTNLVDNARTSLSASKTYPELKSIRVRELVNTLKNEYPTIVVNDQVQEDVCVLEQPDALRLVLKTLASNAIDATKHKSDHDRRIQIHLEQSASMLILRFSDNGTGILPEHQSLIFKEGFTTKPNGNGVGLTTARGIIEAYHGKLELESSFPNHGSTFRLTLPILQVTQSVPSN